MFPDACPRYIRNLCQNKAMNDAVVDELITVIFSTNNEYPKRALPIPDSEFNPENQFEILREVLSDADPDFLQMMCDKFEGKPESVETFINETLQKQNYPKLKDYERKQQLSSQQKQYTSDFNVKNFVKIIPNPEEFFNEKSRTLKLDPSDTEYVLVFLRNTFNKMPIRTIQRIFHANSTDNNCNLAKTFNQLEEMQNSETETMKSVRKPTRMDTNITNIPLLQEIAYLSHRHEITHYLTELKKRENLEREEARNRGLMQTCNCCFDEEVLPRDIHTCGNNCKFCKSCIVKSVEVAFGEGKLSFPCLGNCESSLSLQTLQAVLSPKLFSKIAQRKALEEIKSAGIEELEMCPFCVFATIPAAGYSIFTCLNPESMKESCRMCKNPSHAPLRCEEVEEDADVKARTFVENKMTEALLRKCYKCGVKFFKEEGCNRMTCSCGASMCYICEEPVTGYKHFNGNGGDRYNLCPLYSDTHDVNKKNVLKGAAEAKAELGNVVLKHDPTKDVQEHYNERKRKLPLNHLVGFVNESFYTFWLSFEFITHHLEKIRISIRKHFPEDFKLIFRVKFRVRNGERSFWILIVC
ncbi:E3 ubiquitin-protein ligase RNF216-like isoform X1 [Tribolium madens]|uniref:E3 ubiquitin-protein ligase RNF216-like isoform X1 n=2 Tax=Tribolium madens TaxID=41895 RepID=UPI001CF75642|nr:E3 ubiquitin-protein ligase RNF216-like isoform X1 [Tribolium madens]